MPLRAIDGPAKRFFVFFVHFRNFSRTIKSNRGVERVFHTPAYRMSGRVAGVCQIWSLPETVAVPRVTFLGTAPVFTAVIAGILTAATGQVRRITIVE